MEWVSVNVNMHRKEGFVVFISMKEERKEGRKALIANFREGRKPKEKSSFYVKIL